jgi:hypothetical protein
MGPYAPGPILRWFKHQTLASARRAGGPLRSLGKGGLLLTGRRKSCLAEGGSGSSRSL